MYQTFWSAYHKKDVQMFSQKKAPLQKLYRYACKRGTALNRLGTAASELESKQIFENAKLVIKAALQIDDNFSRIEDVWPSKSGLRKTAPSRMLGSSVSVALVRICVLSGFDRWKAFK